MRRHHRRRRCSNVSRDGVFLAFDDVDFAGLRAGNLASAKLAAILATANPESLTALAALAVPGFAELGLKPDGEEVVIPAGPLNPLALDLRVAMSDDRIAIAAGDQASDRLATLMGLESTGSDPLTAVDLSLGAYFSFIVPLRPLKAFQISALVTGRSFVNTAACGFMSSLLFYFTQ